MSEEHQIGVYRLLAECGNGAFGRVFLAENTLTHQHVALKLLHGKQQQRELEGLIRYRECHHPNLIQIHHMDRASDGALYYTMDLADNLTKDERLYTPDTLAARLERDQRLTPDELIDIMRQLTQGVRALHQAGLIHRDIKPENILFVHGQPVLGDMGLTSGFENISLIGTPSFMPPEVLTGKRRADESCDLYALGMVLYCSITGFPPQEYPRLPKDLPANTAGLILHCRNACENRLSLSQWEDALTTNTPSNVSSWKRRGFLLILLGLLFLLLAACGLVWHSYSPRKIQDMQMPQEKSNASTEDFEQKLANLLKRYSYSDSPIIQKAVSHYAKIMQGAPNGFAGSPQSHDPLYRLGELQEQIRLCAENAKRYPLEMQFTVLEPMLREREQLLSLLQKKDQ